MGNVDLEFTPTVPVFDADVAFGRRHDKRVAVDSVERTIEEMDRAGVGRALVYAPHAAIFDSMEGNESLVEQTRGEPRLVPQFVCNPAVDDLDAFVQRARDAGVLSVRMLPMQHDYPFREWVVGPWLDWAASEGTSIWLPTAFESSFYGERTVDASQLHETLKAWPNVTAVLSEVRYADYNWTMPLLRSLPNVHIEVSRFLIVDGIGRLMRTVGDSRILYGSRFPDSHMAPQLYNLHHNVLSRESLEAICAGNLERLLGGA